MEDAEIELVFEPMSAAMLQRAREAKRAESPDADLTGSEWSFGYVDVADPDSGEVCRRVVFYPAMMGQERARALWQHLWWRRHHEAPDAVAHGRTGTLIEHYEADSETTLPSGQDTPAGPVPRWREWVGPLAVCLGAASVLVPVLGSVLAVVAVGCGGAGLARRGRRRADWLAVAGVVLGAGQLVVSGLLALAAASGTG